MTPRRDIAERRDQILGVIRQAAIEEFAENGLRGASTQAIADRAGIRKTRLHYYITSKEELYDDALRHIIDTWARLFAETPAEAGPEAFLRAYIARKIAYSLDHPEVARLFTNEVMRGARNLRPLWDASRQATRAAAARIEGWAREGLIRPVDPWILQFNIWALTQHWALHEAEVRFMLDLPAGAPMDRERIVAEVTALVLRGLSPETG